LVLECLLIGFSVPSTKDIPSTSSTTPENDKLKTSLKIVLKGKSVILLKLKYMIIIITMKTRDKETEHHIFIIVPKK